MTKEELLRQPATEYMSKAQLGFFRELLLNERREVSARVSQEFHGLAEVEPATAPEDLASREQQRNWDLRMLDRDRKLLKKIEQALERIDDESYGWCAVSGEPIGLPRLLSRPTTELTVEAKAQQELRERHVA